MADKIIREMYVDYDNFAEYNEDIMYYLAGCRITPASILVDVMQRLFKKREGKTITVLHYRVSIDTEDLLWIKLTAPEIILKEVSTSL